MKQKTVYTNIAVPSKLHLQLKRIANQNKRSMIQQLTVILDDWEKKLDKPQK